MAKGQDLSAYQQKIVSRYYEHKDTIVAARLAEIVSDLYLAQADAATPAAQRKVAALWKRAVTALKQTKLPESAWQTIVERQDAKGLAALANRLGS
jgi:hypothetical protein